MFLINIINKKWKVNLLGSIFLGLEMMSIPAYADFRGALRALETQKSSALINEVNDALIAKNFDGANLFLSVLKLYPSTWLNLLSETQAEGLLKDIRKVLPKDNLPLQYKLALAQLELDKSHFPDHNNRYDSLHHLATNGYGPAAFHIYMDSVYMDEPTRQINGIKELPTEWLIKAAELNNPEAAFYVGMKYLNIEDDLYGCVRYKKPSCPLPLNESLGWQWMREAAKRADPHTIRFADYAYWMSELYAKGVAGNEPDYRQSYLWLKQINHGFGIEATTAWPMLKKLNDSGHLKEINAVLAGAISSGPQIPEVVSNEAVRNWQQELMKTKDHPVLIGNKPRVTEAKNPAIRISILRTNNLKTQHYVALDVYEKGNVNLLLSEDISLNEGNDEAWFSLKSKRVSSFVNELIAFDPTIGGSGRDCNAGCLENVSIIVSVVDGEESKYIKVGSGLFIHETSTQNNSTERLIKLIEAYTPVYHQMCNLQVGSNKTDCLTVINQLQKNEKD